MNASTTLTELERAECLHLLGTALVGRVVFTEGALPAIRPVHFVLDGDEIVFRTATNSALAAATRRAVVAFEVDDIDTDTHIGWSVVVIGQAYEITDTERLGRLTDSERSPWSSHRGAHTIAIPMDQLTGRRLILWMAQP